MAGSALSRSRTACASAHGPMFAVLATVVLALAGTAIAQAHPADGKSHSGADSPRHSREDGSHGEAAAEGHVRATAADFAIAGSRDPLDDAGVAQSERAAAAHEPEAGDRQRHDGRHHDDRHRWGCGRGLRDFKHDQPDSASEGVRWQDLSEDQRELLQEFVGRWEQLPLARQRALARCSARWLEMSPEQRDAVRQRYERWQSLDPEQRRELRRRYHEFKKLPPEEQARIRENYRRFRDLTPEQRRELREKFRHLSPQERQRLKQELYGQPPAAEPSRPPQ